MPTRHHHLRSHHHEYQSEPGYVYNTQFDYYGPDAGSPLEPPEPAVAYKGRGLAKDTSPSRRRAPPDTDDDDADYDPRDRYYLPNEEEDTPSYEPSLASTRKSQSRWRSSRRPDPDADRRPASPDHYSPTGRGRSPRPLSGGRYGDSSPDTDDDDFSTRTQNGYPRSSTASRHRSSASSRTLRERDLELAEAAEAADRPRHHRRSSRDRGDVDRRGSRDRGDVDRIVPATVPTPSRGRHYPPSASRARSVAHPPSGRARIADDFDNDDDDAGRGRHRPARPRRRASSTSSAVPRSRGDLDDRRSTGGGGTRHSRSNSVGSIAARIRTHESTLKSIAKGAAESGAVAALKLRHDKSPWLGVKGTKVVAAALGGGMVDAMVDLDKWKGVRKGGVRHAALKQAVTLAFGQMILKPAAKGTRFAE